MFTSEQSYVIYQNSKNLLLLARAGSGKTFTVANKIAEAVKNGLKPEEVLCLTFTVKGADEIKEDVEKYCGQSGVNIFTIHSFCYNLIKDYLKNNGAFKEPSIADEVDVGELLVSILKDYAKRGLYELSDDLPLLPERQLAKIMTRIKHERDMLGFSYSSKEGYGVTINKLLSESQSFNSLFSIKRQGVKITDYSLIELLKKHGNLFCLEYSKTLDDARLLDFDDLIFFAKQILTEKEYKKPAYKLIVVDEMQDTSMLEYNIAKEFFSCATVLMCGDPYQTIYSWRGSAPTDIMQDFIKNYNAETVVLNGNRRSSPLLTYAGGYYLAESFLGKVPKPQKIDLSGYEKISVVKCFDEQDEANFIFDLVKNYKGDKSSLCIMARANRYVADLYKKLERKNLTLEKQDRIPFFTADSDFQFYKKPVIKDFLSFLRLIVNPQDVASFLRVVERYVKGVGKETVGAIKDFGAYGVSLSSFLSSETYTYNDPYFTLMSAYKSKNVVIYDLETTGLNLESDEMIQISALRLQDGKRFNRFVLPKGEISKKALLTHGYDIEHITKNGGKSAKEVLKDFVDFAKDAILVGHNSSYYDDVILSRQLKKEGLTLNCLGFYDTLVLAQSVLPNLSNYKLATCCEHFGVVNERAHDALADVEATSLVFCKLVEEFYIPQTDARRRVVMSKKSKFEDFYRQFTQMTDMLIKGEMLNLIKFIDGEFGVLKRNSRMVDRESANDLYRVLKTLENSQDKLLKLRSFLGDVALSGSQMDVIIKKHGKIPLITVHQSKGCEFDTVILAGASENEMPSYGARQSGDEEEEKRVFYVALSRAKNKFYLTYPSKKVYGQNVYDRFPSPYVARLPSEAVEIITP